MKVEELYKAFDDIPENNQLSDKIKNNIIHKRRAVVRKRIITISTICAMVLVTNVTAYAFSDDYRTWFSRWLGLGSTEEVTVLSDSDEDKGITLTAESYHIAEDIVTMQVVFKNQNKEPLAENLNIGDAYFTDKDIHENSSILYMNAFPSEKSDELYGVVILALDENDFDKKHNICIKNLIDCTNGNVIYDAKWNLEVDFNKDKGVLAEKIKTNPVEVSYWNKQYTVQELFIADKVMMFKTNVTEIEPDDRDLLSATCGFRVDILCKDGEWMEGLYCVPDEEGNLYTFLGNALIMEDISEIKIDGKVLYMGY